MVTSYADRQVHFTATGDRSRLGLDPALTGLTTYLTDDHRAVMVRVGYRYTYWPTGNQADQPWAAYTHRTTLLSLRTGTLRAYQALGQQPMRQGHTNHLSRQWGTPKHYSGRVRGLDRTLADEAIKSLVGKLAVAATDAGYHDVDGIVDWVNRQHPPLDLDPNFRFGLEDQRWDWILDELLGLLAYPWKWQLAEQRQTSRVSPQVFARPTSRTVADLADAQFGKWNSRPAVAALTAALTSASSGWEQSLKTLTAVRSLLDRDTLADLLWASVDTDGFRPGWGDIGEYGPELRRLLRHGSLPRKRRMLTEAVTDDTAADELLDTVVMAKQVDNATLKDAIRGGRTCKEVHDRVVDAYNVVQAQADERRWNLPLKAFPAELTSLNGATIGNDGPRLVIPGTVGDLLDWGQRLQHCIGSYGPRAAIGDTWLFALEQGGQVVATGEIGHNYQADTPARVLTQLRGRHNRPVDPQTYDTVGQLLDAHGVFDAGRPQVDQATIDEINAVFDNRDSYVPF